jgi:hypothetical protein
LRLDAHYQLSVDCLERQSRQAQSTRSRHTAAAHIEAQAVRRAAQDTSVELPARERRAVMGTRVVDRAKRAVDVEQHDASAIDESQLAPARRKFIYGADRYLP